MMPSLKRILDLSIVIPAGLLLAVPMVIIAILIKITSTGPILYWSKRVGRCNELFLMPKFRSMKINTPTLATHLLENPNLYLTSIGGVLRKYSIDELPQLWSIFIGNMSLVGPRPALFNQEDLIALRTSLGVDKLVPGLTGWAQVNGRDDLLIHHKVQLDFEYLASQSVSLDLKILRITVFKMFRKEGVWH